MNVNQEIVESWERLICGSKYLNCRRIFRSVKTDCRIRKMCGSARNDCRTRKKEWRGSVHGKVYEPRLLEKEHCWTVWKIVRGSECLNCVKYLDPGKLMRIRAYGSPDRKMLRMRSTKRNWGETKTRIKEARIRNPILNRIWIRIWKSCWIRIKIARIRAFTGGYRYLPNLTGTLWRAAGLIYLYHWT